MEFIIYRGSWRRGGSGAKTVSSDEGGFRVEFQLDAVYGETYLLNGKSMMCCLGQIAFEAGVPLSELADEGEPYSLDLDFADQLHAAGLAYVDKDDDGSDEDARLCNTDLANDCMPINDDATMDDTEREQKLIAAFQAKGHILKFVDGVAPWFATESQPTA